MGRLDRLVIGTDSPAGSGVQPLGVLRTTPSCARWASWSPALPSRKRAATRRTGAGWDAGRIVVGAAADLVFLDAPSAAPGVTPPKPSHPASCRHRHGHRGWRGEVSAARATRPPAARIPEIVA
jgi:enamidase